MSAIERDLLEQMRDLLIEVTEKLAHLIDVLDPEAGRK